ncbi:MAG TPA: methyltransferase domain-containing protein [Myxococcales bacterium]|nr:methyltransferase domain-containing protein [Myxococcales bacterium]
MRGALDLLYSLRIKLGRALAWSNAAWPPHLNGTGIEIGAHDRPIPGIHAFQVDRYREYAGRACPVHVVADAGRLPFRDSSLDFVATSHLLEHLPDPAAAIVEWFRVTRPGGVVYMIVPDRRLTFDRGRARTGVDHLLDDFARGTGATDPTHIDEFLDRVELARVYPEVPADRLDAFREEQRAAFHRGVREGFEINIHFHVFESADLLALLEALAAHPDARLRYDLLEVRQFFPPARGDGFLVAARVRK